MKPVFSLFLLLLLLPLLLPGQLEKDIERYLTEVNETFAVPGSAVAVLKGDELIYEGYFGLAEMNHNVPVSGQTKFRVYSSTKLLVATAIFQLEEAGKLNHQDPIGKHLEGLPEDWRRLKIADLMAHASGLPEYKDFPNTLSPEEVMEKLAAEELSFPAGDHFDYNQTNYWTLLRIIEKVSGEPLETFILNHQLQGLKDQFAFSSDSHDVIPHRTGQYRYANGSWKVSDDNWGKISYAGNGLAISLPAFIRWGQKHRNGELLGPAATAAMTTEYEYADEDDSFLHGWGIYPVNGQPSRGFTGGGVSAFRYFPDEDLTIIFLSNGSRYGIIHNRVVDHLAGMVVPSLVDPVVENDEYLNRLFISEQDGAEAIRKFRAWRKDHPAGKLESSMNRIGYLLAREGRLEDAIKVFQLNTEMYPDAWNVWDSLGEGHEMLGQAEAALVYYRKSVALNPDNMHGTEKIKQLSNNAQ